MAPLHSRRWLVGAATSTRRKTSSNGSCTTTTGPHDARRGPTHRACVARTAQAWQAGHERTASAAEARSAAVDLDAGLELRLPAHPRPSIHEVNFHGPARHCEPERLDD